MPQTLVEKILADHLVEGSFRRLGDRIRVAARLVQTSDGSQLWADRYDRTSSDIFELQDELTARIAGAIEPELSAAERARAIRRKTDSLSAWELYHKGLDLVWAYQREKVDDGIACLGRATELDPRFAAAW